MKIVNVAAAILLGLFGLLWLISKSSTPGTPAASSTPGTPAASTTAATNLEPAAPIIDGRKTAITSPPAQDFSPWDIISAKDLSNDCNEANESITRAEWLSCFDHHYQLVVDNLRRLINTPDGKPYADVLNATLKDGMQIYEANKHSYLEGLDRNQMNGTFPWPKEQILMSNVTPYLQGALLFSITTPPDPDAVPPGFHSQPGEGGESETKNALHTYRAGTRALALLADNEQFSSKCKDSIDALRAESTKGYEQIAQANNLYPSQIDGREFDLRINYGDMFITDAYHKITYCGDALDLTPTMYWNDPAPVNRIP